jgi:hypothetical protein
MEALIIFRVVAIWIAFAWKAAQLSRHLHDRATQVLTCCFGFLALSTPAQLTAPRQHLFGLAPIALATEEYAALCCAFFFMIVFFTLGSRGRRASAFYVAHGFVAAVTVALTCVFGALAPPTVPLHSYTEPHAVAMYLVSELYLAGAAAITCLMCRSCAREAGGARKYAFGVIALGLGLLAVASALLCVVQIATLSGTRFLGAVAALGGYGLLIGGPVLIIGVYWIAVLIRYRSRRLRVRQKGEVQGLRALCAWKRTTLPTGADPHTPPEPSDLPPETCPPASRRRIGRQWHEYVTECLDGISDVSGLLPVGALIAPDVADYQPLAAALWELSDLRRADPDTPLPEPVLVIDVGDTLEENAAELIRLSEAVARERDDRDRRSRDRRAGQRPGPEESRTPGYRLRTPILGR